MNDQLSTSEISAICYDQTTHLLEVKFAGGEAYEYVAVPHFLYTELMSAINKKEFFELHIQNAFISKRKFNS